MSGAVLSRIRKKLKKKSKNGLIEERIPLFGQYVCLLGTKGQSPPQSAYLLLTNQDLSYSNSRQDQNSPTEVIRFFDILGIFNPDAGWLEDDTKPHKGARRQGLDQNSFKNALPSEEDVVELKAGMEGTTNGFAERSAVFIVLTSQNGYFRGRPFYFQAFDKFNRDLWVAYLSAATSRVFQVTETPALSDWDRFVRRLRFIYLGQRLQGVIGGLITANFAIQLLSAQLQPEDGSVTSIVLEDVDFAFNMIWTVEVCINIISASQNLREFASSAWNWFDVVVVLISYLPMILSSAPPTVSRTLRLLRTLRVFRLFRKIPSLQKLVSAISASIPSTANAFFVVFLIMAIYAIVSVQFFGWIDTEQENFGTFFAALFTMWQFVTFCQWTAIVRVLFDETGSPVLTAIFFVSYLLIICMVLLNVVIASLVNNFQQANPALPEFEMPTRSEPFRGLWHHLSDAWNLEELDMEAKKIFAKMGGIDEDRAGFVKMNRSAFKAGLARLEIMPPVICYDEHWEEFIVNGGILNGENKVDLTGFLNFCRRGVVRYLFSFGIDPGKEYLDEWEPKSVRAFMYVLKARLLRSVEQLQPVEVEMQGKEPSQEQADPAQELFQTALEKLCRLRQRLDAIELEPALKRPT